MEKFNVLRWDFNTDSIECYDVIPYLMERYEERKKRSKRKKNGEINKYNFVPKTVEEFKDFIESESRYMYWSRCEYEMICHGWPVQKNEYKIDVHEQIMMNIDVIAKLMYSETANSKSNKT